MPDATLCPPASLETRARRAAARIAPVWPLDGFVAVNPFLGHAGERIEHAAAVLRRVAGRDLFARRAEHAASIAAGRITAADLTAAGASAAAASTPRPAPALSLAALTVADLLGARVLRLVTDEIGKWAAAWVDEGQAAWPMPWRDLPFYEAWRHAIAHDRAPELAGIAGFRAAVAALPADPVAAVGAALARIGLPEAASEDYLHRALLPVAGWAALFRQRGWAAELAGGQSEHALHLLAVRLAWDAALFEAHAEPAFRAAWAGRLAAPPAPAEDLREDLALLEAAEHGFRRRLAERMAAPKPKAERPIAQAVFCIDVRSEVLRRHIEAVAPQVETLGFAGFFGFFIEYVRLGEPRGVAQCPVLLPTGPVICEGLAGASPAEAQAFLGELTLKRRLADLWGAFRASAVSCFAYVETAGFLAAGRLLKSALNRPDTTPDTGLARLAPDIVPRSWQGRQAGIAGKQRLDAAEAVLRAMSLTSDFGGIVLLAGHGARTVNNPHAAGLDCGACGGHTGESNARVAAAVLNDPLVREGLRVRGIAIPADTWFLAGLHDTVTDEVRLFDADRVPPSQAENLATLQRGLADAAARARGERAPLLGLGGGAEAAEDTARRQADWSEVRPEWALANNAAFIAAPRARTRGVDLSGRAFLHSYDWRADHGFGVLELIMTAPMVVANWINLQYLGSTVDNEFWGSGNKALHNVVGLVGVLEGQGGDLRVGLPWQSVHDGARFQHEPLRLNVYIEAPEAEMDQILAKHAGVAQLVDNGWLNLLAIREDGSHARRHGAGDWRVEFTTSAP